MRDLTRSETDERLVRGIIGIAREFDQTTIAEGIEDQATLVRLRELGVLRGQGYLLGRPQPLSNAAPARKPTSAREDRQAPGSDSVTLVRTAFEAFARRDLDTLIQLCHRDIVVRPHQNTSERTGRQAPYRGHEGLRAYVGDIATVWKSLELTPTAFRPANQSVIVFGRADASSETETTTVDVLWVWRLRDGLIASVEVFQTPRQAPPHRPSPAHLTAPPLERPEDASSRRPRTAGPRPLKKPPGTRRAVLATDGSAPKRR